MERKAQMGARQRGRGHASRPMFAPDRLGALDSPSQQGGPSKQTWPSGARFRCARFIMIARWLRWARWAQFSARLRGANVEGRPKAGATRLGPLIS